MRHRVLVVALAVVVAFVGVAAAAQQTPDQRQQPGAMVHIFAPEQHDLYDGHS